MSEVVTGPEVSARIAASAEEVAGCREGRVPGSVTSGTPLDVGGICELGFASHSVVVVSATLV